MPQHRDCYARALNDCSDSISREHYVSKSVLEIGQDDLGAIQLTGALASQPSKTRDLANAYVLCSKHNEELSNIDDTVSVFLRRLHTAACNRECADVLIEESILARWLWKYVAGWASHYSREDILPESFFSKDNMELLFGRRIPVEPELTLAVGRANDHDAAKQVFAIQGGAPAWIISHVSGNGGTWGISIIANPAVFTVSLLPKIAPQFGTGRTDVDGISVNGPDNQQLRVGFTN